MEELLSKKELYAKFAEKLALDKARTKETQKTNEMLEYLDKRNRTLKEEYDLVMERKSSLSSRNREFIIQMYKDYTNA